MTDMERQAMSHRDENREWTALSAQFALNVRHILRAKGITQRELAKKLDVSTSQVTKILSGKENLSLQTIAKVGKALERKLIMFPDDSESTKATLSEAMTTIPKPYYTEEHEIMDNTAYYASDITDSSYTQSDET